MSSDVGSPAESGVWTTVCIMDSISCEQVELLDGATIGHGQTDGALAHAHSQDCDAPGGMTGETYVKKTVDSHSKVTCIGVLATGSTDRGGPCSQELADVSDVPLDTSQQQTAVSGESSTTSGAPGARVGGTITALVSLDPMPTVKDVQTPANVLYMAMDNIGTV